MSTETISQSDEWLLDGDLGEALHEDEVAIASKIAESIVATVRAQHAKEGPPARRDAHPRAHGLVRASFEVEASLAPELAQGIFVPGKHYPAWVRFSNGDADPQRSDAKGDVRAMAIKVFDVPGAKILPEERDATTQDFVMINSPVFITDHPARYLKALERNASPNPLVKLSAGLALGFKGASIGLSIQGSHITNPLSTRYWSTVPYRLGDAPRKQAIKFSAVPQARTRPQPVPGSGPTFLRDVMIADLTTGEVLFDFMVQPRTSDAMSVEDSQAEWKETEAPFFKVATIRLLRQTFATEPRDRLAENLSFNPWHALPQHRPLGGVNRIRRVVYRTISDLRRGLNGVPRREPAACAEP
jgi:hypothetical protein